MFLTKFDHACFVLTDNDQSLVVDPGILTPELPDFADIVAIVITHEHPDHWDSSHLDRLMRSHPHARIFGPNSVSRAIPGHEITTVSPGDHVTVGSFSLNIFGGTHAVIHSSIPVVENIGLLVNEQVYYAGDSYDIPDGHSVDLLVAPVGAPWLKISEVMDFVLKIAPAKSISTHDGTLSPFGLSLARDRIRWATEQGAGEFIALDSGQILTV